MIKVEIAGDIYELAVSNKSLIKDINKFFPYEKILILEGLIKGMQDNRQKLNAISILIEDMDKENLTFINKTSIYKILQKMIDNREVKPTSYTLKTILIAGFMFVLGSLFAVSFF